MAMITPERALEDSLVTKLQDLKYEYRPDIRDRATLEANFREKFEALNRVTLTDGEFQRLLDEIVRPDVYEAARSLRNREAFIRDDGTPLNYTLVNIKDWCKNHFEVVNQLRINTDNSHHRYDVILLINGVPVVQIELKTLGISPRRAMEQIVDYKNDPGNGYTKTLLCFIQLFIVSNRTDTWYFANNNARHFAFDAKERFLPIYQFAAEDNTKIAYLDDFADLFLAKCTLGQMISKYMVLIASEQKLLMMRPYQIYAVKAIVDCIDQNCGNGYVWHTTGSGKTLTSFKASTLLKTNDSIHKCLFVVDRKDLDRQTREEFNRFQENCVEQNTNTAALVRRLESDDYADKVIVTTIQKLGLALDENSKHNKQDIAQGRSTFKQRLEQLRDKRMVFIFDECHRSQFGENHRAIKEFFPNSQLFGFTGTPIFEDNATVKLIEGNVATLGTTQDLFQKELHAYTITHAIEDQNVLRFHVDYYKPMDATALNPGQTLTKQAVAQAILEKHDAATASRRFNALLATASINDAIEYYEVFKKLQAELQADDPEFVPLKIAAVFSPPAEGNKDVQQIQEDLPQEKEDNQHDPEGKKTALKAIIIDYNQQYGTNHNINNFDLYYQDIQQRIKDQRFPNRDLPDKGEEKVDITIVVDMILTGFDAVYLNTLYVDKNLKQHGLIQAFSRTNRILNATKPYGHILDFRQQHDSVDAAIALFSGAQADRAREIWLVDKAPVVIDNFKQAVDDLGEFMQSQGLEAKPDQVNNLMGDDARAQFINRFKDVQRLQTQLDQYTDLTDEQREQIEQALPKDDLRAFRGAYLDTAQRLKEQQGTPGGDGEPANADVDQLDFEFVLFASAVIDYDYIMKLIAKYSGQDPKKMTIGVRRAGPTDRTTTVAVQVLDSALTDAWPIDVELRSGMATATATVAIPFDGARPASRTVTVSLASVEDPYSVGSPSTLTFNVTERDAALSVADASVSEGPGATLAFAVTLDRTRDREVRVKYATSDGTATQGEDYTGVSGTLRFAPGETTKTVSVPVLDDAHDEGSETLTLRLSTARRAVIDDATAVGTIVNSDPMPDARIGAPGAMTAGTRGAGAMPGPGAAAAAFDGAMTQGFSPMQGGGGRQSLARPDGTAVDEPRPNGGEAIGTPGLRDMVKGSSFYYGLSPDAGPLRGMNRLTAWGESASTRFSGAEGKLSLDGEVNTAILGADGEWGRWLAGLALSYSEGEGGYRRISAKGGAVSSTLTGINPYARYRLDERTSLWGTLGYGSGRLTLTPDGAESSLETDMTNAMAAFGGRGVLSMRTGEAGRFELAVRSDAMLTDTVSDAVLGLAAGEGATSRIRLILEGTGSVPAFGGVLAPTVEAGLRYDGGDAETGAGLEVGGGLAYDKAHLTVQVDGRVLLTHRDRDYEEWGYSLSFAYKPGKDGRGLRYQAGSQWGATQSGVSYSYQWIRVDGVNESDIGEESTATYTPVQDDVGKTLKVRANFTDDAGFDEQRTSAPTATVTAAPATCPAPDFAEWLSYLTTIEGSRTGAGRRDEP